MTRIDEMPEYRKQEPMYTHDLSHKFGFTATVAHLLPVFHDFLNPGETVDLGFSFNLRTQPLTQAAMVDINAHVEYFFVPMFLLYEPFASMYYDINDNYSSLYPTSQYQNIQTYFPVMMFEDWRQYVYTNKSNTAATLFEPLANSVIRLFDHFGFNVYNFLHSDTQAFHGNWNPNVFPYQLMAYQCIYEYYYRLDTREQFRQDFFNWDKFYSTAQVTVGNGGNFNHLCTLRYRPKESDYFTDVKVSPIVDVLNLNNKNSFEIAKNWLSRDMITVSGSDVPVLSGGSDVASPFSGFDPSSKVATQFGFRYTQYSGTDILNGTDIGTSNIRALFATEKLWSITGRARKHYDDQTLAHFGFHVPHDVKHEISCFGHDRSKIHIGEVISTADTYVPASGSTPASGTRIGDIAGKGYGSLNAKSHRFTAPCHGVVMAILSFTPDVTYSRTYLKANSVTSRQDLFTKEYDHLGMQPLFGYEGHPESQSDHSSIIGWQYRYEQWKRRYNRVSMAFTANGSLDAWMLDFRPQSILNQSNRNNFANYLHQPNELDQIMVVNYVTAVPANAADGSCDVTTIYDGDPFVIDGYVNCKKRSLMSDFSLPRLEA